jgi:methylated-DNA-[protein]-cysteine S-methyltransferase
MKPTLVQYEAPGWGVGEVWLDDDGRVFHSELPRPKGSRQASDAGDDPTGRRAAFFLGAADDDSESARLKRIPRGSDAGDVLGGRVSGSKRIPPGSDAGDVLAGRLAAFFAGAPDDFADVSLRIDDGFYGDCARALRQVARGEVVTYGELAALAGYPGAARAAGTFCARCELAPFLPVHRVVAANGIGSWGSLGVDYKRRLLALEGVAL